MTPDGSGGILDRLAVLTEFWGTGALAVLVVVGVVGGVLVLLRGAGFGLLLLVSSYALAFATQAGISSAAFFARVLALVLLTLVAFRKLTIPGWQFYSVLGYVALALVSTTLSPIPQWSMQKGLLLLLTTMGLTMGLASYLKSWDAVLALLRIYVFAGGVWVLVSTIALREFASGAGLRFTGGGELNPTNYADTGALFLPLMLWAALHKGGWVWRVVGLGGVILIPVCLFLSGTRTAMVVSALASIPLLLRGGAKKTARVWMLIGVFAAGLVFAGQAITEGRSSELVTRRLTRFDFTGRAGLWMHAYRVCMTSPVIGHGMGTNDYYGDITGPGVFHNAYLSLWCNTGLIGLLLFMAAVVSQIVNAFMLARRAKHPLAEEATRLAFGYLGAISAMGVVENGFSSPSNFTTATVLIMITLTNRVGALIEEDERAVMTRVVRPLRRLGPGGVPVRPSPLALARAAQGKPPRGY